MRKKESRKKGGKQKNTLIYAAVVTNLVPLAVAHLIKTAGFRGLWLGRPSHFLFPYASEGFPLGKASYYREPLLLVCPSSIGFHGNKTGWRVPLSHSFSKFIASGAFRPHCCIYIVKCDMTEFIVHSSFAIVKFRISKQKTYGGKQQ